MKCPDCNASDNQVVDSRESHYRRIPAVRRRRKCGCGHVWTTYEIEKEMIPDTASETVGVLELTDFDLVEELRRRLVLYKSGAATLKPPELILDEEVESHTQEDHAQTEGARQDRESGGQR